MPVKEILKRPPITGRSIKGIEQAFGFQLYDTFAYCLKRLLSDGEPIKRRDLFKYRDENHGTHYDSWFAGYIWDINNKLLAAGFETRIVE